MEDTVDLTDETKELRGHGQDGLFTLCVCTEYMQRHPNINILFICSHTIFGSVFLNKATLEYIYPFLPVKLDAFNQTCTDSFFKCMFFLLLLLSGSM